MFTYHELSIICVVFTLVQTCMYFVYAHANAHTHTRKQISQKPTQNWAILFPRMCMYTTKALDTCTKVPIRKHTPRTSVVW